MKSEKELAKELIDIYCKIIEKPTYIADRMYRDLAIKKCAFACKEIFST